MIREWHGRCLKILMIKKLVICSLLCLSVLAADEKVVTGADGNQYKLVKPETKLPSGAISIAEYVRLGEKSEVRYALRLTTEGAKPTFWKIQS